MENKYSKGSEWRKWDLHLHSPKTFLNNGFNDCSVSTFVQKIVDEGLIAVGLTNYFRFDPDEFNLIKKDLNEKGICVFPNLEFRIQPQNKEKEELHIHILFSDKVSLDKITGFLGRLKTIDGKYCKDLTESDIKTTSVTLSEITDRLKEDLGILCLKDYLIVACPRGQGSFRPSDNDDGRSNTLAIAVDEAVHLLFGNANDSAFFLNEVRYEGALAKPVLLCSDSHSLDIIGTKFSWIKADPTFEGLKQILREPKDRVYIGDTPLKLELTHKYKTKYIEKVSIKKAQGSSCKEHWFDSDVELNSGLVAIIGNKGQGKSGFAEIIGLLGSSKNYKDFSFLRDERFKKNKLAGNFDASIKWLDGKENPMNLMKEPTPVDEERVKCIPQNYLEKLCNDLDGKFQGEVDSVIFSHIDSSERLGKSSLKELINYKTLTIDNKIKTKEEGISSLNEEIVGLEESLKPECVEKIKNKIIIIEEELRSHYSIKPQKELPAKGNLEVEAKQKTLQAELAKLNNEIKQLEEKIKNTKKEQLGTNENIEKLKIIKGKVEGYVARYSTLKEDVKDELFALLGIELADIIKVDLNLEKISLKLSELNSSKIEVSKLLNIDYKNAVEEDINKSLFKLLDEEQNKKGDVQLQVDEPAKKHQIYIDSLADWRQNFRKKYAEKKEGKKELQHIESTLPKTLKQAKEDRKKLVLELFGLLREKIGVYEILYKPVISFVQKERDKNEHMDLNFSAEIMLCPDFVTRFLSFIDKNRKGSFQGVAEGQKRLRQIIQKYSFLSDDESVDFIEEIFYCLNEQTDSDQKTTRVIEDQLVKGMARKELYEYFYLLKFLKIDYRLKWGDKLLEHLSPGEKGAVLLIFYLLIDKGDIPLIMDQPEENLDNESIYHLLVRYIKQAKNRRQIFIVTHNPNLAVVCDAEQIICCSLDKKDGNKVSYETGSIESPKIKERIINILEGTKRAFGNRQAKYELSVR